MADTCNAAAKSLVTVAHGGTGLNSALGGSIQETIEHGEHRPGGRISPCLAFKTYSLRATARWAELVTPITRNTSASLVFTLETIAGSTKTVTLVTMRAGAASFNFDGNPVHDQSMEFVFDAGNSENYAPITVA